MTVAMQTLLVISSREDSASSRLYSHYPSTQQDHGFDIDPLLCCEPEDDWAEGKCQRRICDKIPDCDRISQHSI